MSALRPCDSLLTHPVAAGDLLALWGDVHGPDPRYPSACRPPGTLALRRRPTYDRDRAARRCAGGRRELPSDRVDAAPHDAIGLNTVWSANAPPAALRA